MDRSIFDGGHLVRKLKRRSLELIEPGRARSRSREARARRIPVGHA
jgi:hypothetical protein